MKRFFSLFFFLLFSTTASPDFDARTALIETQAESARISKSAMEEGEKRFHLDALNKHARSLQKILERERLDSAARNAKIAGITPTGQSVGKVSEGISKKPSFPTKPAPPLTETTNESTLMKIALITWRGIQNLFVWGVVLGVIALLVIGALDSFESGSRFLFWAFRINPSASRQTDRSDGIPHRTSQIGRAFGEGIFPGGLPQKGAFSFSVPVEKRLNQPKIIPRDGVVPVHLR